MMNHDLKKAITRLLKSSSVVGYGNLLDKNSLWLVADTRDEMALAFTYLPELFEDHERLTEAVASLAQIVAQQNQQIEHLVMTLEALAHAQVGVELSGAMLRSIETMVTGARATIRGASAESEFKARLIEKKKESRARKIRTRDFNARSRKIAGKFKDLFESLISLNLATEFSTREAQEAEEAVNEHSDATRDMTYSGSIVVRFGEIIPAHTISYQTDMRPPAD
jgi:hypothetical protein